MMQSRKMTALAMLIISGSIALGGCGSGGGNRLTKPEFAAKANAICSAAYKKLAARENPFVYRGSPKEQADFMAKALPFYTEELASLKALSPPLAEQKTFLRLITLSEELPTQVEKEIAALRNKDAATARELDYENAATARKIDQLFTELGATKCST
jgi:hypothetical protein